MSKALELLEKWGLLDEKKNLNKEAYSRLLSLDGKDSDAIIDWDYRVQVTDDELKRLPYSAIVRLVIDIAGRKRGGTGFLIGKNKVVTAAHCFCECKSKDFANKVVVIPADNVKNSALCVKVFCCPEYLDEETVKNDWCVFKIDKDLGFPDKMLELMKYEDLPDKNPIVEIAGFPVVVATVESEDMWKESGEVISEPDFEDLRYKYRISTTGGQSGSPLIIELDGKYYVIGIHAKSFSGFNFARMIERELFIELTNWE